VLLLCVIIFECNYSSANLPKMSKVILGVSFWGLFWGPEGEVGWGAGGAEAGSEGRGCLKGLVFRLFGFFQFFFLSKLKFVILF